MNKLIAAFCFLTIQAQAQNNIQYVNPLIGTHKMGHTYPGATVPFGAIQLSPDTDTLSYDLDGKYNPKVYGYCAGYRYEDPTIVGFSHTHFSGTGHSDLGDFLVMPTQGKLQLNPGIASNPKSGYRSAYQHKNEVAQPGYYKVKLDDDDIIAEFTASTRVGMHKYTFHQSDSSHIIFDLTTGIYNYSDKNVWTYVRVVNDTLITGYRQTNGWARTRTVYFALTFSKPIAEYGQQNEDAKSVYRGFWRKFDQQHNFPEIAGKRLKMYFNFSTKEAESIMLKLAISTVSQANALLNLQTEVPHWDFDLVKQQAQQLWNNELNKIQLDAPLPIKQNFYTALYHSFLSPTVYMDVNGQYKGLDQDVHQANSFSNYTTFSIWDTYRALHPLFNIIQPKRNSEMVSSMLEHYKQSALHMLPIWSHYANDNWCMSGYHSVSIIADAVAKKVYKGDVNFALNACLKTATHRNYEGIGWYMDKGFIPAEKNGNSVSNTLEYAYDDWCIAQLAKLSKNDSVYDVFANRAANWKNNFNPQTGFMQPRLLNGDFKTEFNALSTHAQGFIEGNSWNYSFFVPHQPSQLKELMGGDNHFIERLDSLFTMHLPDEFFAETEDITREGIIGGYVHGNEPAHHVPYLYNYTSKPYKTQYQVRQILTKQYQPTPDGLGGNDDCGQMSAWYIFSAMGFYPVAPGSVEYAIGSPIINRALLNLENGKTFEIEVKNQGAKNFYIDKLLLNGVELNRLFITHDEIIKGGKLTFVMKAKP